MKHYTNDMAYGKSLLEKIIIGAALSCIIAIFLQSMPQYQIVFSALTIALFAWAVYVVVKYCRCPHCGKVIFLGVLALTACPKCKRSFETGKKVKKSR